MRESLNVKGLGETALGSLTFLLSEARTTHGKRRVPGQRGCLGSLRAVGEVVAGADGEKSTLSVS